jgi:hypothetical protein
LVVAEGQGTNHDGNDHATTWKGHFCHRGYLFAFAVALLIAWAIVISKSGTEGKIIAVGSYIAAVNIPMFLLLLKWWFQV